MRTLSRIQKHFSLWLRTARLRWKNYWTPPYRTQLLEGDLPRQLERATLYLVEEDGFMEQAAMICPCGCGRTLHMNLLPDERPFWTARQHDDGSTTLHPSVWRQKDCQSHFWLRQGRVHWV